MLSIIRRHAGWGVKVLLGAVIVTFVFFFGYNQIQQDSQNVAIKVDGTEITFAQYNYFYDQEYERFRQVFQGETGQLPEFVLNNVKMQAQRILTQRVLFEKLGSDLGLLIPDSQLANWIAENLKTGGEIFDPIAYKDYLSYFQTKNQFSFENLLREDLAIQQTQNWLNTISVPEEVLLEQNKASASQLKDFEKITVNTEEVGKKILQRGTVVKSDNASVEKKKSVDITGRSTLLPTENLTFEEWVEVFTLNAKKPFLNRVVPHNGKFVLIRFIRENKSKKETQANLPAFAQFTNAWFNAAMQNAEIKVYISNEQS